MATKNSNLPTLAELHHDIGEAFKNDKLNLLLNQPPHEKWIKKHPIIKSKNDQGENVAWQYIPIDKIEFMLTRIFGVWQREILTCQTMFNSVAVTVRIHVIDPVTGLTRFHDGGGACPVQTDKGASAADLGSIKSGAIQMALPAAISYATKDAAECFGKLFGKDLNKRDTIAFVGAYGKTDKEPEPPATEKKKANTVDFEL